MTKQDEISAIDRMIEETLDLISKTRGERAKAYLRQNIQLLEQQRDDLITLTRKDT